MRAQPSKDQLVSKLKARQPALGQAVCRALEPGRLDSTAAGAAASSAAAKSLQAAGPLKLLARRGAACASCALLSS
jgi:hypothetical protein